MVTEAVRLLFSPNRNSRLLVALTLVLFLRISAFTWNKKPSDPIYGILGENITLRWNFTLATPFKLDSFTLLRDGDDMIKYTNGRGVVIYEPYNGSVTLEKNGKPSFILINLKRDDGVKYCCKVATRRTGGSGKIYKSCTQLKILVRPTVVSISANQTVNETDDVTLSCSATGKPSPNITWSKAVNQGDILSSSSSLILKNVTRHQDGVYWCTADNRLSKAMASVRIIVQYKPRASYLTTTASKNTAIEGRAVIFHCDADSVPSSSLELRFKGAHSGYFSNGTFTIPQVKASDQGPYECVAHNILGIGQMATLNLSVLVPPSVNFVSHNATANETDDVVLFCNATGNPRPNITWTFLSGTEPRDTIGIRGTLTLPNVTKSQTGVYLCSASNNVMNATTVKAHVTINYKSKIKDGGSTQNIMSWINRKTEIMCEAEGVPVPDITWSRDGSVTSSKEFNSRVSTLTFTPQEPGDFGAYVCQARNLLGSVEKHITIKMLVGPEAPKMLRIDPGFEHLEIHWKASVANPDSPVLDYLVQVKEKDESMQWKNCTQIETFPTSLTCLIKDLKSETMYIVRVAGRNVVGYSAFTEKEAQTKPKEMGTFGRQKGMSGYIVDYIIAGVIGFSVLVVVIIAIVTNRRPCHKGSTKSNEHESSNVAHVDGHDNTAFNENPKTDESDEQV